jgi:hypothetical protein
MAQLRQSVYISAQGELRGERKMPHTLRVLVDGQYVRCIVREADGFTAGHRARSMAQRAETSHGTAQQALARIVRSRVRSDARCR